jgi:hypothetical protein
MHGHPERELYLDIKDVPLRRLARIVRRYGVEGQVIFTTTHHNLIREWVEIVPGSQTLHWMGGSQESLEKRIDALIAADFAGITQLQIHARLKPGALESDAEPFTLTNAFFRRVAAELKARDILYQSLPYTQEIWVYGRLMDLGVQSFASDYPQRTRMAISDYFEHHKQAK